jgi:hypothetical protein
MPTISVQFLGVCPGVDPPPAVLDIIEDFIPADLELPELPGGPPVHLRVGHFQLYVIVLPPPDEILPELLALPLPIEHSLFDFVLSVLVVDQVLDDVFEVGGVVVDLQFGCFQLCFRLSVVLAVKFRTQLLAVFQHGLLVPVDLVVYAGSHPVQALQLIQLWLQVTVEHTKLLYILYGQLIRISIN